MLNVFKLDWLPHCEIRMKCVFTNLKMLRELFVMLECNSINVNAKDNNEWNVPFSFLCREKTRENRMHREVKAPFLTAALFSIKTSVEIVFTIKSFVLFHLFAKNEVKYVLLNSECIYPIYYNRFFLQNKGSSLHKTRLYWLWNLQNELKCLD